MRPYIDDDFSDPDKSDFRSRFEENVDALFAEGRYVLRLRGSGTPTDNWHFVDSVLREGLKGDVACQVVGRVLTERDVGWVVELNSPKWDRDVAVKLRRDGMVEVGHFHPFPQGVATIAGPIRPPDIKSGDRDNTVLVILRGGQTLEIYVNGAATCRPIRLAQPLASVCPGVGLWERCGNPELKGRAEFRRFTVWKLSR
jgi:hypothetical protein